MSSNRKKSFANWLANQGKTSSEISAIILAIDKASPIAINQGITTCSLWDVEKEIDFSIATAKLMTMRSFQRKYRTLAADLVPAIPLYSRYLDEEPEIPPRFETDDPVEEKPKQETKVTTDPAEEPETPPPFEKYKTETYAEEEPKQPPKGAATSTVVMSAGLMESAKDLYKSAKQKAVESLSDEDIETIKSIKKTAAEATAEIKKAAVDAWKNSDNDLVNSVKKFAAGVQEEKRTKEITLEDVKIHSDKGDKGNSPNMVPAICTQCGAPLKVDASLEAAVCNHCGTPFIVSKAIRQYNVERAHIQAEKVEVRKKGTVEATLNYIDKLREEKKKQERREEEERRIEEQRQAAIMAMRRKKRKIWFQKHGAAAVTAGLLVLAIIVIGGWRVWKNSTEGKIRARISSYELTKNHYSYAEQMLRQAGFTDITLLPDPDLIIGWVNTEGQVKTVSIDSASSFSSDSLFLPDAHVVITYHAFPSSSSEKDTSDTGSSAQTNNHPDEFSSVLEDPQKDTAEPIMTENENQFSEASDEISSQSNSSNVTSDMPVMPGTNLNEVIRFAENHGMNRLEDEDFGHDTVLCIYHTPSEGIRLNVIYCSSTYEILCARVLTINNLSTADEQRSFIKSVASILCPKEDADTISSWVATNIGTETTTEVSGFIYELGFGLSDNLYYAAGMENWEDWQMPYYT